MQQHTQYEVIIAGGSFSGLAAAMALGRALRKVLVIDSGEPCNRQTPYSHNFITHDGNTPAEIRSAARRQVEKYPTVTFNDGLVTGGFRTEAGFEIHTQSGQVFSTRKVIFATGIKDILPDIPGLAECWGISALHCPYCHGYEVRGQKTGILGNGDYAFEFASLIANWTDDLTVYTNGGSELTAEQAQKLTGHGIDIVEEEILQIEHAGGYLQHLVLKNGSRPSLQTLYLRVPFVQHCSVPESLGCALTPEGYISVNQMQKTTVPGVFACGDNTTRLRTVANAVAAGTTTGMMVNKELTEEDF